MASIDPAMRDAVAPDKQSTQKLPHAGPGYLVLVQFDDLQTVVDEWASKMGQVRADNYLRDEFQRTFAAARHGSEAAYKQVTLGNGEARLEFGSADDAELYTQKLIEEFEERNAGIPEHSYHIHPLPVVACYLEGANREQSYEEALKEARNLLVSCRPGQMLISQGVYAALSAARKQKYAGEETIAGNVPATIRGYRRRVVAISDPQPEKYVMVVDMSQFRRIQKLAETFGGIDAVKRLQNQIKSLLSHSFQKAGVDFDSIAKEFGGDGGIYVLDSAEQAHNVAVNILHGAEDRPEQKQARRDGADGLHCFRIGIAYGPVGFDKNVDVAGTTVSTAKRLESGGKTGEIRMATEAYRTLPDSIKKLYGGEELIDSKEYEGATGKIRAHRFVVSPRAPWEKDCPPPVENDEFKRPAPAKQPTLEDCFIISPMNDFDARIAEVFDRLIVPACATAGFSPLRVSDIHRANPANIITDQLASTPMAIAYLGSPTPSWNKNVLLEIGFRLSTGLPLAIISEPVSESEGHGFSLTELLPFHLVHNNVITVPPDPQDKLDALVDIIRDLYRQKPRSDWPTAYPIIEYKFRDLSEGLYITHVSPEAAQLFGIGESAQLRAVEQLREENAPKYELEQYQAFRKEQRRILQRLISDSALGMGDADLEDSKPPVARIPIVFKGAPRNEAGQPEAWLGVIARYSLVNEVKHIRVLYLKVQRSLRQENGIWVCDL
jgi:class 3 adenylate cyclase